MISLSPEGLPWKDYKLGQLVLMAPFGLSVGAYLQLVWKLSRDRARLIGREHLPDNAIIYDYHTDVATNFVTMHLLRESGKKVVFAGYHGFLSYSTFGPGSMGAYDVWRYHRGSSEKPFDQIVAMLNSCPDRIFGIFTDAGGPYFQVRESLARLSLATKRPLVPYRSLYSPIALNLFGQKIPAPRVEGRSILGQPIAHETLSQIPLKSRASYLDRKLREVSAEDFPNQPPKKDTSVVSEN
jgi:hypothetical protein